MMKKSKIATLLTLLLTFLCAISAFAFTACKPSSSKISLSVNEATVVVDKTVSVVITMDKSLGALSVESGDTSVATAMLLGQVCVIKGVSEGSTDVTVTAGEEKAVCKVNVVKDNTETVTVKDGETEITELEMDMGTTKTLTAVTSKNSPVEWISSNEHIATVSEAGLVSALKPGTVTLTAQVTPSIKAEIELTVNSVGGYVYYEMELKDEAYAIANPDTFFYWMESWVSAGNTLHNYDNGTVNIDFVDNKCDNEAEFWMAQLFYNKSGLTNGTRYHVSLKINSTAAGHITVCNSVVELKEGEHTYDVYYVQTAGSASFRVQFAAQGYPHDLPEATIAISELTFTEDTEQVALKAPSFTLDNATNVITITDTNTEGVGGYNLVFYDKDNNISGTVKVENGKAIDLSTVANGTYTVKLVAVAANLHYTNSAPSTETATVTIANDKTEISYAAQGDALSQPGTWFYWSNKGYEGGSTPNVTEHYVDKDGAVHLTFTGAGIKSWDVQLFKKVANLEAGKNYKLTLTINSTQKGTITVKGKACELVVGDNNIVVTYTENNAEASVYMEFGNGNSSMEKGTFIISNVQHEEITSATQLKAPSFTLDNATNVITITDTNTAGVGGYELGFFIGEAADPAVVLTVENGKAVNIAAVSNGTYTVKLRAKAENLLYSNSAWSASTASVTVESEFVDIPYGAEQNLVSGWAYFLDGGVNIIECKKTGDSNTNAGTVYFSYSGKSDNFWGAQLFMKDSQIADGAYTVELTIKTTTNTGSTIKIASANNTPISATEADGTYTYSISYDIGANSAVTLISIMFGVDNGSMIDGGEGIEFVIDYTITAKA